MSYKAEQASFVSASWAAGAIAHVWCYDLGLTP